MKIRIPFVTAITSLALLCISPLMAQEEAVAIAPEQAELSDAEMLEIYGWMAGMRAGISRLGLNDEDMKAFILGIDAARSNRDLDVDLQAIGPMISEFVQSKFESHMEELQAVEEAKSEVYWTEIRALEGVHFLESGLAYKIIESGSAVKPTAADTVRVHYTGKLVDGTVFDTTYGGEIVSTSENSVSVRESETQPVVINLSANAVQPGQVKGLKRGLIGAKRGETKEIMVKAEDGFGSSSVVSPLRVLVPAESELFYTVEVLRVSNTGVDDLFKGVSLCSVGVANKTTAGCSDL